ncbi:MAG: extracellular solute-binding protein [Ignavibacteria bacterium]|nr:extracellular solute-binding protein [Ignavibacteria bacterium]
MNLEKLFYIVTSTILITIFLLFTFVLSPGAYKDNLRNKEKTIYYVDHISNAHKKLIDLFNEKYKGQIRVETINLTFDKFSTNERKDLLARYLRSKSNRIDLFSVDIIWVPRFRKWSIPLNNYLDTSITNNLLPHTKTTCIFDDTCYAVPLYTDISLMFYRDDILKKLKDYEFYKAQLDSGITWENFIKLKRKLEQELNYQKPFFLFQADKYEGLMCTFFELLGNYRINLISDKDKLNVNSEELQKAVSFLIDVVHKYNLSPKNIVNFRENESYKYFSENDAFAVRGWPSFLSNENKYVNKEIIQFIRTAPTPYFSGTQPSSVFGGWNLMIPKYSDKISEVIKFLEFLSSPESQKILYEEGGYLPVNKKVYEDSAFVAKHPELLFYKKLFQRGVHRPISESYTTISDLLSSELSRAIEQKIDAKDVINNFIKYFNENYFSLK